MKILLIDPAISWETSVSLGVANLATIIQQGGYSVDIVQFQDAISGKPVENDEYSRVFAEYIIKTDARFIGFSATSENYHIWLNTAEHIKSFDSSIVIFFGGPQATLTADITMERFAQVDYILKGECEEVILDFMRLLKNETSEEAIPALVYRKNEKVICQKMPTLMDSLDDIVIPNYEMIKLKPGKDIDIEVGRGCPYNCTFCASKTFWKGNIRTKSVGRLIDEIIYFNKKFGKTEFDLVHDIFTANKSYVKEFCIALINLELGITWTCSSRVDAIDEEMLYLMEKARCNGIFFGIETGSRKTQREIRKNIDIDAVVRLLPLINKSKIQARFAFMCGFPNETIRELNKTLDLINRIITTSNSLILMSKCTFFPGTELYNRFKNDIALSTNPSTMTTEVGRRCAQSIIEENMDIFPFYYEIQSENRPLYSDTTLFMSTIFSPLYNYFNATIKVMYAELMSNKSLFYSTVHSFSDKVKKVPYFYEYSILKEKREINQAVFDILNELIIVIAEKSSKASAFLELFRFEIMLFEAIRYGLTRDAHFSYDVATMKSECKLHDRKSEIIISISRTQTGFNVNKITLGSAVGAGGERCELP